MNIQKALERVGDRNSYQVFTIIFVCFKWLIVAYLIFLPSYLFINPTFKCGDRTQVIQEQACKIIEQCQIQNIYTITSQIKLYCDKRYLRDSLLSSQYIGSIIGLVLMSVLADKIGRKIIIVVTLFISVFGAILVAYGGMYNVYVLLYAGQMLMGFGGYSLSIVSFIYLSEINCDRWRQVSIILTFSFWAIAQMLFYPFIKYFPAWRFLIMVLIVFPLVVLLVLSYFLIQTPFFLYNIKKEKCIKSLNYIAEWNKKPSLSINQLEDRQFNKQKQYQIHETITKKQFLIPLIILSFGQICNNGMYYITQYSINQIGSSFQMNMLIIGALQFVAYFITNLYCHKMKRKLILIIMMFLSGGIGLIFQFVFRSNNNVWNASRIIQTIFIAISRLANTFGFALFSLITTQSFPTSIKTTGTGIVEALSNLGNMASPFIVTISDKLGIQSMLVGGIIIILGALSMFFAKQTLVLQANLPENQQKLLEQQKNSTEKQNINQSNLNMNE